MRGKVTRAMRASVLALAAVLFLAHPRVAEGGAVVFASDQGYFGHESGSLAPRETYETLDRATLEEIVRGLLGAEGAPSGDASPAWVDAAALARAPPSVVVLGAGRALSPADLAGAEVAAGVRRAGAELVAPNARVSSSDAPSIATRALASHEGARFVVGECGDAFAAAGVETAASSDAFLSRRRTPEAGSADLVVACDLETFAELAASLRAASVPHAAVFLGAESSGFEPAENVAACVAETRGALELRRGGRALLQDETEKVCDDLCQLQTNVVSGLVFLWVIALPVLFGYALMHNLDSPTRFEKSKDDDGR
jgi:hypothetical protein